MNRFDELRNDFLTVESYLQISTGKAQIALEILQILIENLMEVETEI